MSIAVASGRLTEFPPMSTKEVLNPAVNLIEWLERIAGDRTLLRSLPPEARHRFHRAITTLSEIDPHAKRKRQKAVKAAGVRKAEAVLNDTGIRALRRRPMITTPNVFPPQVDEAPAAEGSRPAVDRVCYVCKKPYFELHHFYDQLCPACAEENFAARTELADLRGRVALLTGGRVKIGYQAGLKLLRCGAHLIVTTRFPRNSAERYAQEPDFGEWSHRLEIYGLDLRHIPSVEAFCRDMNATRDRLDFIINNACQTVRRPPEFYTHMMAAELSSAKDQPEHVRRLLGDAGHAVAIVDQGQGVVAAAQLSQVPLLDEELVARSHLFPAGRFDNDLQQVDLRDQNSWRMLLADVPTVEMLEVRQRDGAVPVQRATEAADAAHRRARQAHRECLSRRRTVLPRFQDHAASAHQHGEGGAEHDDAHGGHRLCQRWHSHEQRRYRLGDRRGPDRDCDAQDR